MIKIIKEISEADRVVETFIKQDPWHSHDKNAEFVRMEVRALDGKGEGHGLRFTVGDDKRQNKHHTPLELSIKEAEHFMEFMGKAIKIAKLQTKE